jgi:hypothetical protein
MVANRILAVYTRRKLGINDGGKLILKTQKIENYGITASSDHFLKAASSWAAGEFQLYF